MTEPEVNEIYQRCRQSAWGQQGLDTGSPDFDNQRDSFVEDTIAQIDEEIGNCREPSNQAVQDAWETAAQWAQAAATIISGHEQATSARESAVILAGVDEEGYKPASNLHDNPTVQQHKENEGQEKRTFKDGTVVVTGQPVDKFMGEPGTTKDTIWRPGTAISDPYIGLGREAGSHVVFRNGEGDQVARQTIDSHGHKSPMEYYDPETGEDLGTTPPAEAPTMDFTEEEVEEAPDGGGGGSGGGSGGTTPRVDMPEDPDSMSLCQQAAAAWAALKAHCDASQWQTYECAQVLRTFNGCVDVALIKPGPDGDVTCPHYGDEAAAELARQKCEQKGWIMLPSGFDSVTCRDVDFDAVPPKPELCSDPRIMCLPDQMVQEENGAPELPRPGALPQPERGRGPGPVERRAINRAPSADAANPMANWAPPADVRFPGLTDEDFDDRLAKTATPTLVVFGAASCAPCKRVQRNLQGIKDQFPEKVDIRYVEVPQNPRLAEKFDIRYTPTIAMFEHGNSIGQRRVGAATSDMLLKWVQRCLRVRASKEKEMEEAR